MAKYELSKTTDTADGGCACIYTSRSLGGATILYSQSTPCPCPDEYPGDEDQAGGQGVNFDPNSPNYDPNITSNVPEKFVEKSYAVFSDFSKYLKSFSRVVSNKLQEFTNKSLRKITKKEIDDALVDRQNITQLFVKTSREKKEQLLRSTTIDQLFSLDTENPIFTERESTTRNVQTGARNVETTQRSPSYTRNTNQTAQSSGY